MKTIEEALLLTTEEEIRSEVNERHKLIHEMVGDLYPSILRNEITQLYRRWYEIAGFLPSAKPVDATPVDSAPTFQGTARPEQPELQAAPRP